MNNRRWFVALALCLMSLAAGIIVRAQSPTQAPPVFTAGVDVVELDVSALDADRKPVRGLKASDFKVFEDGRLQEIVAFTAVEIPPPVRPPVAWMRDVTPDVESNDLAEHRLFVIILDDALTGGALWTQREMRNVARRTVDGLGSTDEAAVIFTGEGWNGQSFTSDRTKLLRAVDILRPTMAEGPGCAPGLGSARALRAAAEALAKVPHRRKTIVYISNGRGMHLFPGILARGCGVLIQIEAEAAVRAAQLGNVNIYGLDPSGLRVKGGNGFFQGGFLEEVSSNTGGWAVGNTNDLVSHVSKILEATNSYYLIGYKLANRSIPNRYHRLEVKVDRPGVEVRARTSRYDPKPPDKINPRRQAPSPTELSIGDFLPSTALRVEVTTAPFASAGDNGAVHVALGVQLPAGTRVTGRDDADVLIRAFTVDGRPMGSTHQVTRVTIEPAVFETPSGAAELRFQVASRIDLKPGRYTLRIAVHSRLAGKTGSVYTDVVVPNFNQEPVSLSGLMLSESVGASFRGDALAALTPTTTRVFGTGDRVQAFFRIYQAGSGSPTAVSLKIRIVDDHDAAVVDWTEMLQSQAFVRDRQADYSVRLPLSGLREGAYWMSIEALVGKNTVRRDVRFLVKD